MSTPVRLAGFVLGLLAVFGAAAGLGHAVGPLDAEPDGDHEMAGESGGHGAEESGHGGHADDEEAEPASHLPGGLMVSQDGYTLALERTTLAPGRRTVAFAITGPDGEPVTSYEEEHDKDLHLIAVRRDLTGFQHVHPVLDGGRWTVQLDLDPAQWRLFADFTPEGGPSLTLGADVVVPGDHTPATEPAPSRTARVDGYEVTLAGDLAPGTESELTLRVTKDGEPVTDLQPYLAAYGHLVALRAGDLAYLHVHPDGEPGDGVTPSGPEVTFLTEVPSAGAYRLFLDFKHEGVVRTAAFPVLAS